MTTTDCPCWELTQEEYDALVWVRDSDWNNHTPKEEWPTFPGVDWERLRPLHEIVWISTANLTYTMGLTAMGICAMALYEARDLLSRQAPVVEAAQRHALFWAKYYDDETKPSDIIAAVREFEKGGAG